MLKRASDISSDNRRIENSDFAGLPAGFGADGIDFKELFKIARRRGPMVAVLGFLAALLGAVYALQLTPVYTASATLLIDTKQSNVIDAEAVVSGIGRDSSAIESELELIKSYDVSKRVVIKLKLDEQPVDPVQPSLIRRIINLLVSREAVPDPELVDNKIDQLARNVAKSVQVQRRGWTYVVDVQYTDRNPALAAQIANAFADEYLVDQLESRYEATRRANEWLNQRLGELREKVRDSERAVELYKVQNNIVETEGTTLSDQQVAKLNEQLILARAETAQARAKYQQIQAVKKRGGDITAFADALQSTSLAGLKAKASEVRRELANLSAKYGERHPAVVSARAQLRDVNRSIGSEAQRILASAENELRVARSREESIEKSLAEVKGTATTVNQAEITLRELEREAAANKALFESFLSRFKQTSEQEKLNTNNSRVIERASAPSIPSAPNKKAIVLLATMLGLGLGAGLAFLLEQLDSGYRTTSQVEKQLGVPVLANVPRADDQLARGLGRVARKLNPFGWLGRLFSRSAPSERRMNRTDRVSMSRMVVQKPLSTFTEAVRSMRMGIKFADVDRPQKVILVTSALPGEGKSTIASNLAQLAAASGERVLLMDLDLRHPVTTSLYAPDAQIGSVELLLGEADLKQVIVKDKTSGLHVIPSPSRRDLTHTAELLGSQRLKDLLGHLSDYYDLIILDTSPLLPVTDGRALIEAVDSLALVVRWEKTARDAVEAALKQSPGAMQKLTGVVLNDVVAAKARYYDYYKSGYYAKNYSDYYGGSK
jgi:succinoglycan biosynthesis transport protein ExoP